MTPRKSIERVCNLQCRLSIARSNVSTSLKELQNWGLIRNVHVLGDRRDHFETMGDVWEMFRLVLEERKRREIDPTLEMLRSCVAEMEKPGNADDHVKSRLRAMLEFFETVTTGYEQLKALPTGTILVLEPLPVTLASAACTSIESRSSPVSSETRNPEE